MTWCELKGLVIRTMPAKYMFLRRYEIGLSSFYDRRKDRQTDRQTDGRISFNVPRFRLNAGDKRR